MTKTDEARADFYLIDPGPAGGLAVVGRYIGETGDRAVLALDDTTTLRGVPWTQLVPVTLPDRGEAS